MIPGWRGESREGMEDLSRKKRNGRQPKENMKAAAAGGNGGFCQRPEKEEA